MVNQKVTRHQSSKVPGNELKKTTTKEDIESNIEKCEIIKQDVNIIEHLGKRENLQNKSFFESFSG